MREASLSPTLAEVTATITGMVETGVAVRFGRFRIACLAVVLDFRYWAESILRLGFPVRVLKGHTLARGSRSP